MLVSQAFPPANAIFAGIGVLLLVGVFHRFILQPILTRMALRRLKMRPLAKTSFLTCLTALNDFSAVLRFTLAIPRRQL